MDRNTMLKLAAKAVGLQVEECNSKGCSVYNIKTGTGGNHWAPNLDDGDSRRLEVDLQLNVVHRDLNVDVYRGDISASEYVPTYKDRAEAMRWAVLRCAAYLELKGRTQ